MTRLKLYMNWYSEAHTTNIPQKKVLLSWTISMVEGGTHIRKTVDRFGLGVRNDRKERFPRFAIEYHKFNIPAPPPPLINVDISRQENQNHIDYILVRNRWRILIRDSRTKPSAHCGSDHKILVANLKVKLRRTVKATSLLATPTSPAACFQAEPADDYTYTCLQAAATLNTNKKLDNKPPTDKRKQWMSKQLYQIIEWNTPTTTFLYATRSENTNAVSIQPGHKKILSAG